MYIADETLNNKRFDQSSLRESVVAHLGALVSYVFMHCKPARPSQARWTGVPHVAQWALGLSMWHRILTPLFAALTSSKGEPGPQMSGDAALMDADVAGSGSELPMKYYCSTV